jgi:hypothetical protein
VLGPGLFYIFIIFFTDGRTPWISVLYSFASIIRMIKSRRVSWKGHVARMREKRDAYRILVENLEGKRLLGRPNVCRWTILKWILETGWCGMDWINLAQDKDRRKALVNTVTNFRVP